VQDHDWGDTEQPKDGTKSDVAPKGTTGERPAVKGPPGGLFSVSPHAQPRSPLASLFAEPGPLHIGIVGAKKSGKSCLFWSILHRTRSTEFAGALSSFLRNRSLYRGTDVAGRERETDLDKVLAAYRTRKPPPTAYQEFSNWYDLELTFASGFAGFGSTRVNIRFSDGAGEIYSGGMRTHEPQWLKLLGGVRVVVFCLPLSAVFPQAHDRRDESAEALSDAIRLGEDLKAFRERHLGGARVRTLLALTKADKISGWEQVSRKWIEPYTANGGAYVKKLRRHGWLARYLANARLVSEAAQSRMDSLSTRQLLEVLDLGFGKPWVVPISAYGHDNHQEDPLPVHVELPILLGLCDRYNVLM
jgi:hypothetical protein